MKAILIEDDHIQAFAQARWLREAGFTVTHCETGLSGLVKAVIEKFDVIVTDIDLPDIQGDKISKMINSFYDGEVPIFSLSANPDNFPMQMTDDGIACRMPKP